MTLPAGFAPIDFGVFHRGPLATWCAGERGRVAGRAARHLSRRLCLSIPHGAAFTYRALEERVVVEPGAEGADTVLEIDADDFAGLVHELEAPAGLLYGNRLRVQRGDAIDLMTWETPLRALYHGRTPYDPAAIDLRDVDGRPLDVARAFAIDDDPSRMAHFLRAAGYLLVRGVFGADEIHAMLDDVEVLRREARPGDKLSWWGRRADGREALCRVTRGCTRPALAALRQDARLARLKDLADEPLVPRRGEGDGVAVIFKQPGIAEGLGDLPWHRDCGMGGHALNCPNVIVSVFLTGGSPATGELCFLPGSRTMAFNGHDPLCRGPLPAAHFDARPGDVTLHYGDTVHAAPPPLDADAPQYRISAILGYGRADARHHRGEDSYNAALHRRDDGQVQHLREFAERR